MFSVFHQIRKSALRATIALCLSFLLTIFAFVQTADAAKSSMSGDYVQDTVLVAKSLKETIAIPNDSEERSIAKDQALALITDYISRYRNRPQVNGTTSFTTMQTALNAMAGHYKTFANRPLPEKLKDRLNKELSRVEKIVVKEI